MQGGRRAVSHQDAQADSCHRTAVQLRAAAQAGSESAYILFFVFTLECQYKPLALQRERANSPLLFVYMWRGWGELVD